MKIMFKQSVRTLRASLLLMPLAVPTLMAKKLRVLFASASILMLLGIASPSFADSRLQVFLSLGNEGNLFQDIDYENKVEEPDVGYGGGVLLDWTLDTPDSILTGGLSGHGISIDYYDIGEDIDDTTHDISSIFVGYRYHFLGRFYAGASIALASEAVASIEGEGLDPLVAEGNPIAFTLGYSHRFPLGLTLGVHYMNSIPTDYEINNPDFEVVMMEEDEEGNMVRSTSTLRELGITEIEDLTVTTIGATIGFRF